MKVKYSLILALIIVLLFSFSIFGAKKAEPGYYVAVKYFFYDLIMHDYLETVEDQAIRMVDLAKVAGEFKKQYVVYIDGAEYVAWEIIYGKEGSILDVMKYQYSNKILFNEKIVKDNKFVDKNEMKSYAEKKFVLDRVFKYQPFGKFCTIDKKLDQIVKTSKDSVNHKSIAVKLLNSKATVLDKKLVLKSFRKYIYEPGPYNSSYSILSYRVLYKNDTVELEKKDKTRMVCNKILADYYDINAKLVGRVIYDEEYAHEADPEYEDWDSENIKADNTDENSYKFQRHING